ncbi:uncharacterized protein LACBIDRAFT_300477 [Laccaria bicolor S238N-H82]|uniref:Predicted protein n=1 Tax=Laccaria bicolor (strain S238N-H82 / ATCC MYA-4686) TaxID=486041 RepID=B0DGV5_LACBS|nr:uncharacterized protein LACBIDRAFT_300477 [Laccaria bicolor S238N-H82]EDR06340.1 predicted protein [Laccaria bicolor S238N-H82]|eukprot:XP_001883201.1 predicted protein [Laccaria bicolor S238N-H82]
MAEKDQENGHGSLQTESSAEAHRRGSSATWRTNRGTHRAASTLCDEATSASHSTTAAGTTY